MKNVAILISSLRGGGAERVATNLTKYLDKEKYTTFLIVFDAKNAKYDHDATLVNLDTPSSSNLLMQTINFIRKSYRLSKVKSYYSINTTISLMEGPNLLNIITRKKDKIIVSIRGYRHKESENLAIRLIDQLARFLYKRADYIVPVSKLINERISEKYNISKDKIKTIYNSYDNQMIKEKSSEDLSKAEQILFGNSKYVVTVGRFNHLKGHWHLIRAFSYINAKNSRIKLIIIGEGELNDYYYTLIDHYGLHDIVFILDFQENPFKYMRKSSLFLLPSIAEGFPNALVEAMICGVPVMATDCQSGPREILDPSSSIFEQTKTRMNAQYGILIPVLDGIMYNANAKLTKEELIMAEAIIDVLNDKAICKYYSQKSRERAATFDFKEAMDEWEKLIDH